MNPILVTLAQGSFDGDLTKNVSSQFLDKSFKDLLEYMLDPNEDELNSGYTALESRTQNNIKTLYQDTQNSENEFTLAYISSNELIPKEAPLQATPSKYSDLIHQRNALFDQGQTFQQIQLMCDYRSMGG